MIAEPRQEYKVSVVREAIEEALALLLRSVRMYPSRPNWALARLLHDAWLSLPKCLVCGAEDGQSGRVLVRQYMAAVWHYTRGGTEWSEPVCTFCRRHPSISVFEEF